MACKSEGGAAPACTAAASGSAAPRRATYTTVADRREVQAMRANLV
jgi:hypothetical protein